LSPKNPAPEEEEEDKVMGNLLPLRGGVPEQTK
jgi:hypothetical protein